MLNSLIHQSIFLFTVHLECLLGSHNAKLCKTWQFISYTFLLRTFIHLVCAKAPFILSKDCELSPAGNLHVPILFFSALPATQASLDLRQNLILRGWVLNSTLARDEKILCPDSKYTVGDIYSVLFYIAGYKDGTHLSSVKNTILSQMYGFSVSSLSVSSNNKQWNLFLMVQV